MAQGNGEQDPSGTEAEPLVGDEDAATVFKYNRRATDWYWGVAYILFLLFSIIGGIWTATHRNPQYHDIDEAYLRNPHSCPVDGSNLLHQQPDDEQFNISDFMRHASSWLGVSAICSLLVGVAFLSLFRYAAGFMTRATIAMQIAVPLAMGIGALSTGQLGASAMGFLLAGLGALVFYLWRNEIALCARLLGLSAEALHDNPGIIGFVLLSQLVNAALALLLLAFTMFAYEQGSVLPNPEREGRHKCVNAEGEAVQCCVWQPSSWAQTYMSLNSLVLLWTVFTFFQMRNFVVSGTIAQWYFSPPHARAIKLAVLVFRQAQRPANALALATVSAVASAMQGTTVRSVKYAMGPQFGTIAFAGAVLTFVQIMRSAAEQARQKIRDGGNPLLSIVVCLLECIASIIEFLTKFTVVMSAITGESLLEAGHHVTNLLRRNFLNAIGVWWFPPMIIQLASFSLAAAWGLLLYTGAHFRWSDHQAGNQEAVLLGVLSFLMAFIVLNFCGSVLLNIVDALFICYAIDRDRQAVTKTDVHAVFALLPVGTVVEQPGGEYAYGAPTDSSARVRYVPPAEQEGAAPGPPPNV